MNFALPEDALQRLAAQLNLTGTFNHTVRSAWNSHQVMFRLRVERATDTTAVKVEMGGQVHSITVASADPQRHLQVADLIDAIANGRVDSAEPAPARVTRQPLLPEPEPLLDTDQRTAVERLVQRGGVVDLHLGFAYPIRVAVHRTINTPGITAILSIGERHPRTKCFTVRDNPRNCTARLLQSIEHLAIQATPRNAAAA